MKNKKKKNFNSISDLEPIVKIINEAYESLGECERKRLKENVSKLKAAFLGASIGKGFSIILLLYMDEKRRFDTVMPFNHYLYKKTFMKGVLNGALMSNIPAAVLSRVGLLWAEHLLSEQLLKEEMLLCFEIRELLRILEKGVEQEDARGEERTREIETIVILLKRSLKELEEDLKV